MRTVDLIKGSASEKITEYDRHLKKAGGYNERNVIIITTKMSMLVRIKRCVIENMFMYRTSREIQMLIDIYFPKIIRNSFLISFSFLFFS